MRDGARFFLIIIFYRLCYFLCLKRIGILSEAKVLSSRRPIIVGMSRLASSGSSLAYGPYLALCLVLSIGISAGVAIDEAGGDVAAKDLYRFEGVVLVIDWSPEVKFSLNSTGEGDNSSQAGTDNDGLNASLGVLQAENVSADSGSTSASLNLDESGAYGGAASGAHLGWASWDPQADAKGRHAEYGRRVTDLVGVFSIEMNIKLGSNLSSCPGATEWMPCL